MKDFLKIPKNYQSRAKNDGGWFVALLLSFEVASDMRVRIIITPSLNLKDKNFDKFTVCALINQKIYDYGNISSIFTASSARILIGDQLIIWSVHSWKEKARKYGIDF